MDRHSIFFFNFKFFKLLRSLSDHHENGTTSFASDAVIKNLRTSEKAFWHLRNPSSRFFVLLAATILALRHLSRTRAIVRDHSTRPHRVPD